MKNKALVLMLLLCPASVFAQNISGPPYIAVHGEAKTQVIPDIFPLTVILKETSYETAQTQERIEALAREYLALAEAQGLQDTDITVGSLNISPETDYDEKLEKQVFLGNTYERELKFRFHSLEALGRFIAKAPVAKQVQLGTESFAYSKSGDERRRLLVAAIADAHTTAEDMAKGIGMKIVGVQTISNRGFNVSYAESSSATTLDTVTVEGTALLAPGVVLKKGQLTLEQDVYIIYLLGK
jgi:uncharacterized protein YggE